MLKQRHQARFASSMATVFTVLLRVLGRSRWASERWLAGPNQVPQPGCAYARQHQDFSRRGRVVECRPPVALTLYESILDPPCRVRLRLRWRLEPADAGCLILLDAGYQLNGAAYLNRRHWRGEIHTHCKNLLSAVALGLEAHIAQGETGVNGQKIGSNNITVTKTTTVNGSPIFK